jgi:L-threonylcarbamoyladenylate synthase
VVLHRLGTHPEALRAAAEILGAGGVVIFPTETFYGLAADPWNPAALAQLAALKGRPDGQPISLVLSDLAQAERLVRALPARARQLAARYWPGPLTLVLPARPDLPAAVVGPYGVGMRLSPHPVPTALAAACGVPLTATSANRSGQHPTVDPDLAASALPDADGLVDGGQTPGGAPSTVLAVDASGTLTLLRAGACDVDAELS